MAKAAKEGVLLKDSVVRVIHTEKPQARFVMSIGMTMNGKTNMSSDKKEHTIEELVPILHDAMETNDLATSFIFSLIRI